MKWIEVIETNREKNVCYIAYCHLNPYWATNLEIKLDAIETIMGCKFDDGSHPFVRVNINEEFNLDELT